MADQAKSEVVTATPKVKDDKDSPVAHDMKLAFDFEGCDRDDLKRLIVSHLVIKVQGMYRTAVNHKEQEKRKAAPALLDASFNVKRDFVDKVREKADPVKKAETLAEKMTPEQREQAMANLQALMDAAK